MTAVVIELRRGLGKWLCAPLIVMGVLLTEDQLPSNPSVWPLTVYALCVSLQIMGPVAAGVGVLAGSRSIRRNTMAMELLATRGRLSPGLTELAALITWTAISYVVVVGVVYGRASLSATWSSPDVARTIAAGMGLLLSTTFGYVMGRMVPRRLTPVFVAVFVWVLSAYVRTSRPARRASLLLPADLHRFDIFNRLNPVVAPAQIVFYVGMACLLVAVWGYGSAMPRAFGVRFARASTVSALPRSRDVTLTLSLAAGLVLATPAAVVLAAQDGRSNAPGVFTAFDCAGSAPSLCLHPALASARPRVLAAFDPIAKRLESTPFALRRIEQLPRGIGGTPSAGSVAFGLDDASAGAIGQAASELSVNAFGVGDKCFDDVGTPKEGYSYAQLVSSWAAGNPSLFFPNSSKEEAAQKLFLNFTTPQAQRWITSHAASIRACALTSGDFK